MCRRSTIVAALALSGAIIPSIAAAQTSTLYHLHKEASLINGANKQLKTTGPDAAQTALQTANLKNWAGSFPLLIAYFETQSGVPNRAGTIASGSVVTFSLRMKITALPSNGNVYPHAILRLNTSSGPELCRRGEQDGLSPLTTTLTPYPFTCTTTSAISMTTSDRFFLEVGVWGAGVMGNHNLFGELDIETNADSTVTAPDPAPNITSLSVTSGIVGDAVTITGTGFETSGTVTFNGTTASTSSWNATTIQTTVPAAVAPGPGPIVVTVSSRPSNGFTFTAVPHITTLTPATGAFQQAVTIAGTTFGTAAGTVTFNGASASTTSWNNTSIATSVPSGATTGLVVVTAVATASNGATFTVLLPSISSPNPAGAAVGQSVTISGSYFGATQGASTVKFNGTTAAPGSWSDTSITTPVPAGATSGPVVVTVGGNASNGSTFTVITTGTVAGSITRATGGAGLSGATVQAVLAGITKGTATSAADGSYSIPNLDPGAYDVRVLATGYSSEVRSGTSVSANVLTTVNVAMLQPGSISGKVTQIDGITPIVGAAVTLFSGPFQKGSASTNTTGDYSIANLHPGAYTVQAADVGYRTKEQGATILESANTTSNVSLDAATVGSINYVYDELGRLVSVIDQYGDAANYVYDAVGNLLSIARAGSTTVSISEFTPNSGPVGTTVTIYGTGFSTTPASNQVTFGGTPTTVTAATANQLTVTAPAAGQIAVSAPNGSANTGTSVFAVTAAGPPTITNFTPATAESGTAVTVNGTNFETAPTNDNLSLNVSPAQIGSATATAIQSSVPPSATAGRVTVATPNGSATSANYLWIAPAPYHVADIDSTGALAFGTGASVTVPGSKAALRVFDGTDGHRASVKIVVDPSSPGAAQAYLYDAFGKVVQSVTSVFPSGLLDVTTLRSTATYSVIVAPQNANTAITTVTAYDVPADFTGTLTPTQGGSSFTVAIGTPGQNGSVTFSGTATERVSLQGANGTIANQVLACDVYVSILNPDGTVLVPGTCMEGSGFIDATPPLTTTGTYKIVVDPVSLAIGNLPLTLFDVPADVTGPIAFATATPVTTMVPGRNARLTFTGTQGHRLSLDQVGFNCFTSSTSILDPSGGTVATTCGGTFLDVTNPLTLPGTYTVLVDPKDATTGSTTVTLYDVPADVTGSLTVNGPSVPVTLQTPGQNALLGFSVASQQQITVHATNNQFAGTFPCLTVSILNSGGSSVASNSGCTDLTVQTTLAAGSYTVKIDPIGNSTNSLAPPLNVSVTNP